MTLPPEALPLPAHLLERATLLPSRYDMMPLLPKRAVFAEVGVGLGDFSEYVMAVCDPTLFVAIDEFRLHEQTEFWGRTPETLWGEDSHGAAYRARFSGALASGRVRVLEGDSAACLAQLDDASVDIIYLDADHRYEFVRRDLQVASRKVRGDGWIVVNDYLMVAELESNIPYGVVNATNEFMVEHEWGVQYFALQTRMFCDMALRPRELLEPSNAGGAALKAENERLREEVASLRQSTSWRITAPLRAAARLARGQTRS